MGFFKSIGDAIYREYDRRIKRASLVTEYGAHHHTHAEHTEAGHAEHEEAAEEAEIVNVPRGTPVASSQTTPSPTDATH